ncbi:MAG: tetratricopeptide repeat protein [Gammaproteobacteria bacterium]
MKHIIIHSLLLALVLPGSSWATPVADSEALALYEAGDYKAAIKLLKSRIETDPDNSALHHLLGKSYGRQAEKSVFWKAIKLAKKTRKSMEKAVQLDTNNIPAIEDLIEYYQTAPNFLGGSKQKAKHWQNHLNELQNNAQLE